jgi:tetratricopeptide (TPR) repeat protein
MFFRKADLLDALSAAVLVLAGLFVVIFFWQAAAGDPGSEERFLAGLLKESEKRIDKERSQIAFLHEMVEEGRKDEAWEEGLAAAARLQGNSQFHLFLARGYRERGDLAPAITEYRRAVEANRDYTDRRSPFYLGKKLKDLVREGRAAYLAGENRAPAAGLVADAVRNLFFLERSLAGGCH